MNPATETRLATMSGEVVHFELPADNVERAQTFYRKTFGWKMDPIPGMGYTMVGTSPSDENGVPKEPGAINGGMARREAPLNAPVFTILVDDIEGSAKAIAKNGGKVVRKKMEIGGGMGYAAYFADCEGNIVGLYQRPKE